MEITQADRNSTKMKTFMQMRMRGTQGSFGPNLWLCSVPERPPGTACWVHELWAPLPRTVHALGNPFHSLTRISLP